ncbi:hypothetical protein GF325_15200 [Candidatus Bathyarchaeota archaeon]|nr:hypothetical protein [Candidatus Bathyarchaeota archaeon]
MSFPTTVKKRQIDEVEFSDEIVWIQAKVTGISKDAINVDDGTGTLRLDRGDGGEEDGEPCKVIGNVTQDSRVRVIGRIIPHTDNTFTVKPEIIQDMDGLDLDSELMKKVRALEQQLEEVNKK